MTSLFGQRWADSYGPEPDELWTHALTATTESDLKRAIKALMQRGGSHPPTLPEFLELAKPGSAAKAQQRYPEPATPEWNDLRAAIAEKIARQSRDRGVQFTDRDRGESAAAMALIDNPHGTHGHDEAQRQQVWAAARRMAPHVRMTPEQLVAKWDREAEEHRARDPRNRSVA